MQSPTRFSNSWLPNALLVLGSCLFSLIFLEALFRILPTCDATYVEPTTDEDPINHYSANRDYLYSKGWNFEIQGRKHSNNAGFINDENYYPKKTLPIISVIGDSFIVANQVDNAETYPAMLSKALQNSAKVYSFAVVGAPLSQYLKFAEFAKEKYQSEYFVFNIVSNDFHESLMRIKSSPGFHYFEEQNGDLELKHVKFNGHSLGIKIARELAIARYFFKNISSKHDLIMHQLFEPGYPSENKYIGYVAATLDDQTVQGSILAVDKFFEFLNKNISKDPAKIIFVLDGIRPDLYSKEKLTAAKGSYFDLMRTNFKSKASEKGYSLIDMQDTFAKDYEQFGEKFEFRIDAHWNELAHFLVAQNLLKSSFISSQFQSSPLGKRPAGQIY